eukprot:g1485.t1
MAEVNTPPWWFSLENKIERKKLDYTLITRKQSINLPRKLLFTLQNILRKIHDNSITNVDLTNFDLGDYGALAVISSLEKTQSLTYLNLTNIGMGDFSLKRLAIGLAKNRSLTSLICGQRHITRNTHNNNLIGNAGLKAISKSIIGHPTLTYLDICSDRISDNGMEYMCLALEDANCNNM